MTRFYHCTKIEDNRHVKISFQCFPSKMKPFLDLQLFPSSVYPQVTMDLLWIIRSLLSLSQFALSLLLSSFPPPHPLPPPACLALWHFQRKANLFYLLVLLIITFSGLQLPLWEASQNCLWNIRAVRLQERKQREKRTVHCTVSVLQCEAARRQVFSSGH